MEERKWARFLPWIILLLALLIRLWGLNFSLPLIYHVDEERFCQIALNYLRGDLNPHFFHVPSLYTYSVAGLWKIFYLVGHGLGLDGKFASPEAFLAGFGRNPTIYVLLGRLLTLILSVATILGLYFLGKRYGNAWVGTLAAIALTFSPEHNKISHYLAPDGPMLLFLVLSSIEIVKIFETGKLKHYFLSGLFAGLAFTTKYGGHFLVLPLLLAHFFRGQGTKGNWRKSFFHPGIPIWGVTFLIIFFLGTPYALLDFPTFWRDFRWQSSHLFSLGHFGSSTAQPAWLFYLQYGFAENTGLLFQFLVYAGLIIMLLGRRKKDLILLSFPLLLFLLMGTWKTRATRYLLPLTPFFILIGAIGLGRLTDFWRKLLETFKPLSRISPQKAATALFIILIFPSALKVLRFNYSLTQEDTRTTAKHWIEANIPPGTRLALESYCPQVSRKRYRVTYRHALYQADLEWLARRRIDYLIVSDIMSARFTRYPEEFPAEARFYQSLEEKAILVKVFAPRWDEYLLDLHNPTLKIYRLSRLPDPSFPGNFASLSQRIRLSRKDKTQWEIATSLVAVSRKQEEQLVRNLYLRGEDKDGKEVFVFYFHPQDVKPEEVIRSAAKQRVGLLRPGTKLYLGYEVRFLRQPLRTAPEAFYRQEINLVTLISEKLECPVLDFLFYYQSVEGERGEDYFQKIWLEKENSSWRMKAAVYGGELRWGNDVVLNPWVELVDPVSGRKQRVVIFSGRLGGGTEAAKGPAEIDVQVPDGGENFKVMIGYDFYADGDLPGSAGGPRTIPLTPPPPLTE